MLGSLSEADDAVQEAWLRLSRADTGDVENLRRLADHRRRPGVPEHAAVARSAAGGAARGARARPDRRRRETGDDPEQEAVLADSVGLALLVVLETLTPAERLAFVLHDMFAVPFDEIAPMLERSPAAARQLASRARRRVQGAGTGARPRPRAGSGRSSTRSSPPPGTATSTRCVAVLDPDVVLRADGGDGPARPTVMLRGARGGRRALLGRAEARPVRPPGAGQRRRRRRSSRSGGRLFAVHGVHRHGRPDRRDRRAGRPRSGWPGSTWHSSTDEARGVVADLSWRSTASSRGATWSSSGQSSPG